MKFTDALKLMNDGNTITRNGKTFVKKGEKYRFTFADRLSRKWYVPPIYLEGISKYECANCKTCQNETQCPNSGYCYLWNKEKERGKKMKKVLV